MTDILGQELSDPVRRDRWGRYLVVPSYGAKPKGYTRATTVAKALDSQDGLMKWSGRMILLGLLQRPDLLALAGTIDESNSKELNRLCDQASEAGGSVTRRNLGTAVHSMLEQSLTLPDYQTPEQYRADIEAIHAAVKAAGGEFLTDMVERIVVLDELGIAGTFDGIIRIDGILYLFDLKTGSLFGGLSWAIQLAIYAHADALYLQGPAKDGSQDTRFPMPEVNRERGIIIHCEPGSGHAELHWLDIATGHEALQVALKVRDYRNVKPISPFEIPSETPRRKDMIAPTTHTQVHMVEAAAKAQEVTEYVDEAWRKLARERIGTMLDNTDARTDILREWPSDIATLRSGDPISVTDGDRLSVLFSRIERDHGLPFADVPTSVEKKKWEKTADRNPAPYEGDLVGDSEIDAMNKATRLLEDDARAWIAETMKACSKANRNVRLRGPGGKPVQQRLEVCKALVMFAPHADDHMFGSALAVATGSTDRTPVEQIGEVTGSLTIEQARRLQKISRKIDSQDIVVLYDDDGIAYLFGNTDTL
jgi:hypothetical protein